jgi:hypothetical protein
VKRSVNLPNAIPKTPRLTGCISRADIIGTNELKMDIGKALNSFNRL